MKRVNAIIGLRVLFACMLCGSLSAQSASSLLEAQTAIQEKRYEDAIPALEAALKQNPYHLEAAIALSEAYGARKNFIRARSILETALRYHPNDVRALEAVARISLGEEDAGKTQKAIDEIKKRDNKNAFATYAEGVLQEWKGYTKGALLRYERAAQLNPDLFEANIAIAHIYRYEGNARKAQSYVDRMNKKYPTDERPYLERARIFAVTGEYARAHAEIAKALHYYPAYAEAKAFNAELYIRERQYANAIAVIETLDDAFYRGQRRYLLGALYERKGDAENALREYGAFLENNPDEYFARLAYERVLFAAKGITDPLRVSASAYYTFYAEKYARGNDAYRAELYYKRALRLHPTDSALRRTIATFYRSQGTFEKYFAQLTLLRELEPENFRIESTVEYREPDMKRLLSRRYGIEQYRIPMPAFTVAVFDDFVPVKTQHIDIEKGIAEIMAHAMHQFPRLAPVERYDKNYSESEKLRILRDEAIDYVIEGSVIEAGDTINVEVRLLDARTRSVVKRYNVFKSGKEKIVNAVFDIAKAMNADMPSYAVIHAIRNEDIVINAGRNHGVTNGMRFIVYDTKTPRFDFQTKRFQDSAATPIGEFVVSETDENVSVGRMAVARDFAFVRQAHIMLPGMETNR